MSFHFRLQKISVAFFVLLQLQARAQTKWPAEIPAADGSRITVYEPQPEKYPGSSMYARAAVSIVKKQGAEPVFGVMWFNAVLQTSGSIASVQQITVAQSKFADNDAASKTLLKSAVEKEMPAMNIQFDVSRLQAIAEDKEETGTGLKNDPPQIIYRSKPTTLIVLDGEPVEQEDEDLRMTRVVNSPYLIVKNPDDRKYYLYGGSFWYSSSNVQSGWVNVRSLPSGIKKVDAAMKVAEKEASMDKEETSKFTSTTEILVSTVPAELIQTEGTPTYQAVEGSTLLYVNNSLDEIFKDIDSQKNYILVAGRWYRSTTLNGPWEYVAPDALPAAFTSIPAGSEKDGVLASVAGTDEANEALIDARVPQTAKVERSSASCKVEYDGAPRFVPIENTHLSVAENSNLTVMLAPNDQYYALENGVWFIGSNANGPWQVANDRPADVDKIPPSNSAYNARYVYVYQTTPQYVYVGYTRGYMGNYISRRTVVWGTGWRYRPWYGRRFWPRPYTWGFGMHYNPWVGWSISFGLGFNTPWYYYRSHHGGGGGWFGPPMFRPPYRPWGWNGGYYGNRLTNNRPVIRPNITVNRPGNWNRPLPARPQRPNNIYDRRKDVVTRDNIQRPVTKPIGGPGDYNNNRPTRPGDNNGSRPGITRPITTPGHNRPITRPVTRPGDNTNRPVTRPVTPPIDNSRPVTRPITRPVTRPSDNNRPVIRPVTRPVNTQPVNTNRPVTRPATRPAQQPSPARPITRPGRQPDNNRPVARPLGDRKRDN
ncbi:MAG: hypothetical protein ABIQ88_01790 [Chitinophagaceae bacterium]